jgi:hypothetical protein
MIGAIMGLRSFVKKLERTARGQLASFELADGTTYYYNEMEAKKRVFVHALDCTLNLGDAGEDPPEILRMIARAKDRRAALKSFLPRQERGPIGTFNMFPYELEPFLERGEFVPHTALVDHDDPGTYEIPDMSEDSHKDV